MYFCWDIIPKVTRLTKLLARPISCAEDTYVATIIVIFNKNSDRVIKHCFLI